MTPEERAQRKQYWAAKQREAAQEAAVYKADTEGLFGVNGPLSRGFTKAMEYARVPAILRGVNRSSIGGLERAGADLIGLANKESPKADERALFRDQYISDRTLRPGYGDVLDRILTVGTKWIPDILFLRGLDKPVLAAVTAPKTIPTAVKGAFSAHPVASTVNTGIIGNFLKQVAEDAKYVATGKDTYAQGIQDRQLAEQEAQYKAFKDAVSEETLSKIYKEQDLTPAEKNLLIQAQTSMDAGAQDAAARHVKDFERIYTKRKTAESQPVEEPKQEAAPTPVPEQTPSPVKAPVKKPFDWMDYKGELGFGALGGAAGYGLGHILKWGMPAKLLSALTGAALSAYGYNRLKG